MRWLMLYIRSVFCKHEWETEEQIFEYYNLLMGQKLGSNVHVSATCKKCGWHRRYKKF